MHAGWILLAYVTVQRVAELWWAKQNEARLLAAGGIEYGQSHLPLMQLLHTAWLLGMWALAYDHAVEPVFLASVHPSSDRTLLGARHARAALDHPRHRGGGRKAGGKWALSFYPPSELRDRDRRDCGCASGAGLPIYALLFSVLNAIVLSIRIPQENGAHAENAFNGRR